MDMRTLMRSLVVVLALLLAGCSAGGGATSDSAAESESGGARDDSGGAVAEDSAGADEGGSLGVPAADADLSFVTEGSVSLTVDDPAEAAQKAAQLVEAAGGHVQERVEQGGSDGEAASAYLVVRIPSTEVTGTLAELKQLGTIENSSLTSTEVTSQVRDLDARIRALQISVARLEDLLSRAGSIADVVEAEQVLTQRQSELESLQSQAAGLAERVQMATFRLDLYSEGEAPTDPPSGFWAGLVSGWNALVATLTAFLQVLGVLLPWLLFAGLLTAGVIAATRWLRRRGPATAPASAHHPSGPPGTPYDQYGRGPEPTGPGWPAGPAPAGPPPAAPASQPEPQHAAAAAPTGGIASEPSAPVRTQAPGADDMPTTEMPATPGAATAEPQAPPLRRPRGATPPEA